MRLRARLNDWTPSNSQQPKRKEIIVEYNKDSMGKALVTFVNDYIGWILSGVLLMVWVAGRLM